VTYQNLLNLVKTGSLKAEAPDRKEFEGLVRSGLVRLNDAQHPDLSLESRFDLAYNASHALALAALRLNGFRSENRYLVFLSLAHTLDSRPPNGASSLFAMIAAIWPSMKARSKSMSNY